MSRTGKGKRGVVLIVVLWVVVILAVVCLALGGAVRFRQVHLRRSRDELASRQALLSAAALAKNLLLADAVAADTLADGWAGADPQPFALTLDGMDTRLLSPQGRPGLADESARLNANTASAEMLAKLPGMTVSVADAFVAAREAIRRAKPAQDVLACPPGLTGPYATPCRLADALVSAFAEAGLYRHIQGGAAEGGPASWACRAELPAPVAEALKHLTVYSRQRNVDAAGRPRTNINTAPRADLAAATAGHFSDEQIDAILLSRAVKVFGSVGELLTREMQIAAPGGGKRVIRVTREQLQPVVDRLTASDAEVISGLVNVNTAPAEVLRCLPGLTDADVAAITAHRGRAAGPGPGQTSLASIGWLLDVLSERAFAEVCRLVTPRSQQFRMHAEARPTPARDAIIPGGYGAGAASAHRVGAYALAVLERDAGRCAVLLWLTWMAPDSPAESGR